MVGLVLLSLESLSFFFAPSGRVDRRAAVRGGEISTPTAGLGSAFADGPLNGYSAHLADVYEGAALVGAVALPENLWLKGVRAAGAAAFLHGCIIAGNRATKPLTIRSRSVTIVWRGGNNLDRPPKTSSQRNTAAGPFSNCEENENENRESP